MNKDILIKYIQEGLSTYKISERLNCSQTNVRHWLRKFKLSTKKKHLCPCGEINPDNFYGKRKDKCKECFCMESAIRIKIKRKLEQELRGPIPRVEFIVRNGYRAIPKPEHPAADKNGYVYEHRVIAEETLGKYLTEDEVVHHRNENKQDNSPENLQVLTNAEHTALHNKLRKASSLIG